MIFRAGRLVVALLLALAGLASCSSANSAPDRPSAADTPAGTPTRATSAPASPSSPAPTTQSTPAPPPAPAPACTPPADAQLRDQDPDDEQVPWRRNGAAKVVINFETKGVPADWVAEMQRGVEAWNRSPCLDIRLVDTCPPNSNCVTVSVGDADGDDGNFDAVESDGFTTGGHIDLSDELTGGERTNVTIHEMGHAVGLAHRSTERVLMNGDTYGDVFEPDDTDFHNLLVLYGGQS